MDEVKEMLADNRLLTLTGPGGCSKTRLALAVARNLVESYPDGVRLVELAPLSDEAFVAQAVASAFEVREQPGRPLTETLVDALRPTRMLIVLDNCEHLVEGCAALADALLHACPDLKILATGREALSIAGEASWLVPPLSMPDSEQRSSIEELGRYEAARLFVERAAASRFELTEENASAVARVCRKLDGIPLAIELAAARMRVLSTKQIASRLDENVRLLKTVSRTAPPR